MIRLLHLALAVGMTASPAQAETAPQTVTEVPRPVVSEIVSLQSGLNRGYVGSVAAEVEIALGFPLLGTLAERPVRVGDLVEQGALLARQDPRDLDASLRAAEAGVSVAEAQANSAADAAARATRLVARGVSADTSVEAATSALAAARGQVEQAKATLAQAQDARDLAVLTAPQAGVVTEVYAEPGATLTAGQAVLRLAATDRREVVIDLTDQDAAAFSPGTAFVVRLESATQVQSTASLRTIDPVADAATRTRRLHLTLAGDAAQAFRIGALVQVEPAARTEARLTIPLAAVTKGTAVWRVERPANTVRLTPVRLGPQVGDRVLVESGLTAGDEVVIRGVNSLQDGQKVGGRIGG